MILIIQSLRIVNLRLPAVSAFVVPVLRFIVELIDMRLGTVRSANATSVTLPKTPRYTVPDTVPQKCRPTRLLTRILILSKPARIRSQCVVLNSQSSRVILQICGNSPRKASSGGK